jgi:hypothetical protein
LYVSYIDEPNIRNGENAVFMYGTLEIANLTVGNTYVTFRYDSLNDYPKDGNYSTSNYTSTNLFTASKTSYVYVDPKTINSSGCTYYVTTDWPPPS